MVEYKCSCGLDHYCWSTDNPLECLEGREHLCHCLNRNEVHVFENWTLVELGHTGDLYFIADCTECGVMIIEGRPGEDLMETLIKPNFKNVEERAD